MLYSFIKNPIFNIELPPVKSAWGKPAPAINTKPVIENEEENKKLFSVEWSKSPEQPFDAACRVFEETKVALWVAQNWVLDPEVIAFKNLYKETAELNAPLLDKLQLANKVLQQVEEKNLDGSRYLMDAKDRISGLKLYAEIAGYVGKIDIDASTKNFINNEGLKVVFVTANSNLKTIEEPAPVTIEPDTSPLKIKLVSNN